MKPNREGLACGLMMIQRHHGSGDTRESEYMKINLHLASIAIFSVFSTCLLIGNAFAGNFTYTCEVKHVYQLSEKGGLENDLSLEELFIKAGRFSISKNTGRITGNQTLTTPHAFSTRIIHLGSNDNSFKAIAMGNGAVESIQVNEHVNGVDKPFIKMDLITITTGFCR